MTFVGQHRAERQWREFWIEWASLLVDLSVRLPLAVARTVGAETVEWARWWGREAHRALLVSACHWEEWPPSTLDSRLRYNRKPRVGEVTR